MKGKFSGKVVLVTGASRGIGMITSRTFAEKGASVYMLARNDNLGIGLQTEFRNRGLDVRYLHMDITDKNNVDSVVDKIIKKEDKIDILVHSAGQSMRTRFIDMSYEEWAKVINVNLNGSFLICKAVGQHMIKRKYGKIVIISSGSALTGTGGGAHYATSKAGQIGFTRALANELSRYNINVNSIAPRSINTELLNKLYPTQEKRKILIDKIPIGRIGEPEDIANIALFLSCEDSSFISGQYILADGGRTFS
ncbi:MAG: SDR family oxidoreductase [Clostridium sp.]|jgi:3-oxoacyl-[acyl-carrier protein] reductase|uniref:SDR family NAD(P)-dependent oxidoreductase n=1 Tax=Clostridium sp. TaxID=1506 RepID=UPI0025B86A7C|nr:SDR family NAD(P)-dependent oxidoreductase [Clostridium sp.]MCH3965848.1 SDR family oxidoreductase [Clostridium sp.]MCI1716063.1 SDR family oxidoreductase [Clostridium sp.]MCI1800265.1 SDR family oxidoreductase [Clostridium sp.]MCI1814240.1 SDR family oxidoreductase [Clostridium sp.]MCI1871139.1 SDR family oxidoreductase [Clostridium sp.]